jgi:ABC-type uncharacterized transport system substrate-binding protein
VVTSEPSAKPVRWPGGNVTGVSFFGALMESKRLGLLHEMVPQAGVVAVLLNPSNPVIDTQSREIEDAAHALGLRLDVHRASTDHDIEAAFTTISKAQAGALLIASDPFFNSMREKLAAEAAHHMIPAISDGRQFPQAGGIMNYGTRLTGSFHQVGVYTGQILRGAKPADLPCSARRRRHSASKCHHHCSPAPTRSSNEWR